MSEIRDALSAARVASALLERAILTITTSDEIDSCDQEDMLYHLAKNRLHVDLTADRLHAAIVRAGGAE